MEVKIPNYEMIKKPQKKSETELFSNLRQEKINQWKLDFYEYIEISNKIYEEEGSPLDQWKAF